MTKSQLLKSSLLLTSSLLLVACAPKPIEKPDYASINKTEQTSTKEIKEISSSSSSSEMNKTESETVATVSGFTAKTYADTDNMEFSINGKVYKLGETTLQTLINDGVPFEEKSLANIENNVNPNSAAPTFHITLDNYWTLQVNVVNFTESPALAKDLPISDIYYPHKTDKEQSILKFAFPTTITVDDLKANSGEPTETDLYNPDANYKLEEFSYKYESSKYYRPGGITFEYENDLLKTVHMTYIPK